MSLKLKVKLRLAIGKRKALLQRLHERHRHHLESAEWCKMTRNAEHFEAHVDDMRKIEDVMCNAIKELGLFSDALQKIGIDSSRNGRHTDIIA